MFRRKSWFVSLLIFLFLAPACAQNAGALKAGLPKGSPGGKLLLRSNLKKGMKYSVQANFGQRVSQTIMGQPQDSTNDIGVAYDYNVLSVDASGTANIQCVYTSFYIKQSGPMGEMEYQSGKPAGSPMAQIFEDIFGKIVGHSFTMKLTPDAHITDVKGVDEMINEIFESKSLSGFPAGARLKETIKEMFGQEAMTSIPSVYPKKPVAVGDTWKKSDVVKKGFPLTIDTTYTLKDRANGVATIGIYSDTKTPPNPEAVDLGIMKIRFDVKGDQKGTMLVDEETGQVLKADMTQQLTGTVTPNTTVQQLLESWPVSMTTVIGIEMKKK